MFWLNSECCCCTAVACACVGLYEREKVDTHSRKIIGKQHQRFVVLFEGYPDYGAHDLIELTVIGDTEPEVSSI